MFTPNSTMRAIQLLALACLLLASNQQLAHGQEAPSETGPEVVVNPEVTAPELELTVDGDLIHATYYEPDVTGEEYTQERRDFDNRLFAAIEKMSEDVLFDIIEKHRNFLQLAGHAGSAKALIGVYLPEYSRLVDDGKHGRPAKNEFLSDALSLWWDIQETSGKEAAKPLPSYEVKDDQGRLDKGKTRKAQEEAKKQSEVEFMVNFRKFMQNLKYTIANSPVGIYLNWKTMSINGRSLVEMGTPFLTHLRRYNGMSIKLLNMIVGLLGRISL